MRTKKNKTNTAGSFWKTFFNRGVIVKISFVVMIVFLLIALCAPLLATHDPNAQELTNKHSGFTAANWLGTDQLGRDVYSRLIFACRTSLACGVASSILGAVIGILLGIIAGYMEGLVSGIIMRITDAMIAIPGMVLALVLTAFMNNGALSLIIAISISLFPSYVRLFYSMVLQIKANDYITAASLIGASKWRIMFSDLLPNAFPPAIVMFTTNLGSAILMESGLSYLGIGIAPPTATWGGMVSAGYSNISKSLTLALLPGVCIILCVIAFSIIGDAIRDTMDPRLRGKI